MDKRHNDSAENKQTTAPGNGFLSREDYWRAQYEKEKELNDRFDKLEESLERNIEKMFQPVKDSQEKLLERLGGIENRIGSLDGRIANVETLKDQKFKKSLEHIITGRNVLLAIIGGGTIFGGAWSWLQSFFQ